MGLIEFLLYSLLAVGLCGLAVWVVRTFFPNAPVVVQNIFWAVAVLIIVVLLLNVLGIMGHDIQIPRIR